MLNIREYVKMCIRDRDYRGEFIQISGQFRSYNRHEEKKNRLVLSVFAREAAFVEAEDDKAVSYTHLDVYKRQGRESPSPCDCVRHHPGLYRRSL